ncbi:MAG TPA: aminotransferase class V-fold PLP-dependent enzyme [Bacteroidetes bacterium]|nr:aminotransferase class V-fold PLP-dependent enzyme [Bacteroidota bacterium]
MDLEEFRKRGHELVDWMADYFANIESYPVKSQVKPKEIIDQLPDYPPETGEPFERLMSDFISIIIPGMTHWQHPSYFAYFNANNSYPSVLAEMLTATLGAQCMIWQTSPAAAELEERVMQWTGRLIGLPESFTGVIQDTASTATLCSLLTAREKFSNFQINENGFYDQNKYIIYCSGETHSSIEKAVKIAGFGKKNLHKVTVNEQNALLPGELEKLIIEDSGYGFQPMAVVATIGTTGTTAIDPLRKIGEICQRYGLWLHVDAAYAGTALVLPEMRHMIDGIEHADTFVFNPHKWMFTNFDCSAYFVQDKAALIRTFEIMPEYLKTKEDQRVNNYRDWGIQLGRRFRALKLWFVIRSFGVQGLRDKIAAHIAWAQELAKRIESSEDFELMAPVPLAAIPFRYHPKQVSGQPALNQLNARLLDLLNAGGKIYLTHTITDRNYILRLVIGQTNTEKRHVDNAWMLIKKTAEMTEKQGFRSDTNYQ